MNELFQIKIRKFQMVVKNEGYRNNCKFFLIALKGFLNVFFRILQRRISNGNNGRRNN